MENKKLPPDFKAKWVAALRSGEYKQGKTKLRTSFRDGSRYCPIAIFAISNGMDISRDGWEIVVDGNHVGYTPIIHFIGHEETENIWWMNDLKKMPFSEIADYIEKNL